GVHRPALDEIQVSLAIVVPEPGASPPDKHQFGPRSEFHQRIEPGTVDSHLCIPKKKSRRTLRQSPAYPEADERNRGHGASVSGQTGSHTARPGPPRRRSIATGRDARPGTTRRTAGPPRGSTGSAARSAPPGVAPAGGPTARSRPAWPHRPGRTRTARPA